MSNIYKFFDIFYGTRKSLCLFKQFASVMRMMSVMGPESGQCWGQRPVSRSPAIGVSVYTGAGELTSDNEGVTSDMAQVSGIKHISHNLTPSSQGQQQTIKLIFVSEKHQMCRRDLLEICSNKTHLS